MTFLGAVLLIAACETKKKYVVVDDDGGTSSSGGGSAGTGGSKSYGEGCQGLCAKVVDAGCGDTTASCMSECNGLTGMTPAGCSDELDALISCQIASGTAQCVDGKGKLQGCDAEGTAWFTCLQGGTGGGGAGGGGTSDCYATAECNPLDPTTCSPSGSACDVAQDDQLHCFPPPNTAPVGGACDASAGPYCAFGATCLGGTCAAFCCDQSDCASGTCQAFNSDGPLPLRACF
ncbi:MAG: hypothetical protein KC731_08270 [Myxococcales bacterium]|nr:hypothetical protein [Myxococcales bacterium]